MEVRQKSVCWILLSWRCARKKFENGITGKSSDRKIRCRCTVVLCDENRETVDHACIGAICRELDMLDSSP